MALLGDMRRHWMSISGPQLTCPHCGTPRWIVDKYLACEGGCRLVWIDREERRDHAARRIRLRRVAAVVRRWQECGFIAREMEGTHVT